MFGIWGSPQGWARHMVRSLKKYAKYTEGLFGIYKNIKQVQLSAISKKLVAN
jgi:hypothetical protein